MKSLLPSVLTINGGLSSIRFAVYEAGETPRRRLDGKIARIGLSGTNLVVIFDSPKPTPPSDVTPQTAELAFELYEQECHRHGHAIEDWEKAEEQIRNKESFQGAKPS